MIIDNYGILLKPLTLETAMLVRKWRNSPRVNCFMDFKDQISEQQQVAWFAKSLNSGNFYFLICQNDNAIGMIHLDRFDDDRKTAYAGLFIGNEEFEGTGIAFKASISLLEFAFKELGLTAVFAKVKATNLVAINYNKTLGFIENGEETENFLQLKINKELFQKQYKKLTKLLPL